MNLLLDTHALLWALDSPQTLRDKPRDAIADADNLVYISVASLWEIQIKQTIGKVKLPKNFFAIVTSGGFELLTIAVPHIQRYGRLPLHHRDPFDRMLVAQATCEHFTLVTRDSEILKYDVSTMLA